MRAYGEMEQHGKYTLEDFGGWSRNHTKAASIRRWKRPLKKRARQVCRAVLRRLFRGINHTKTAPDVCVLYARN